MNKRPTWCHSIFYFISYVLNMFRTLIYQSSGACDYSVELPHWSYCSWFDVCWSFGVVGLEWYPCCSLLQPSTRIPLQPDHTETFTVYVLNMFRTLIYPSSGACEFSVELQHWSYCSWFLVSVLQASACNTDTTPTQPHRNSNKHGTKNNTTNVVIQQKSRKLLMMDILTSETCWAHKKWNKIASDIKLVFYSSTIAMMHSPATRIPLQPNHTETPTHIEPRTIRPMW